MTRGMTGFPHGLMVLLITVLVFLQLLPPASSLNDTHDNYCAPSSCGNIPNISNPFRLKGDPPKCGDTREIAAPIRARERSLTFEELHDLLVGHDSYLRRLESATQQLVVSANYTNRKPFSGNNFQKTQGKPSGFSRNPGHNKDSRPHNKPTGRPTTSQKRYQPKCQFCDQIGHTAKSCPQLSSHSVTANCTSTSNVPDNKWLMDSAASHNITGDLKNLSIHSEYDGTDEVVLGDGSGQDLGGEPIKRSM